MPPSIGQSLFLFNRPERTAQLLAKVLEFYRPQRLYFAVDGPRVDHPADIAKTMQVAALEELIPKETIVSKPIRNPNLGCRRAVSEAITCFLENEASGITLKDDMDHLVAFLRF